MECKVCFEFYDQVQKRPKVLPCGHTFCSLCVSDLLKQDFLKCPHCRAVHRAADASEFPYAYEFEELIMRLKESSIRAAASESEQTLKVIQGDENMLNKRSSALVEDQQASVLNTISICEDMVNQLQNYKVSLDGLVLNHQELIDKLLDIIEHHKRAQDSLNAQKQSALSLRNTGLKHKQQLEATYEALVNARLSQEMDSTIEETSSGCVEVADWVQECRNLFPDVNIVYNSAKVQETTKKALEMINYGLDAAAESRFLEPSDDTKYDILEMMRMAATVEVKMETFLEMDTPMRQLVESGQVVAVQEENGRIRHARLTLDEDVICLHHLQDLPPPTHAFALPFQKFMDRVNTSFALAFLDLSWPDSPPHRVFIRMDPNNATAFTKQFVLMCTAELGPSYANTQFTKVSDRGRKGERILAGDYDGQGGKPIVPFSDDINRRAEALEGILCGSWPVGTQFTITTRSAAGCNMLYYFGYVERGLEVVKSAVNQNEDLACVTIVDCGIVV